MSPDQIRQGANYDFTFQLSGNDVSGFTYLLEAKQYPDDTATISRAVTADSNGEVDVTLTPTETAGMNIGLWYLTVISTDSDEEIQSERRVQVTKSWVT